MGGCLFCGIADGSIPARVIHADDLVVAFEDINPVAPLHVLVIPREHIATINDLTPEHEAVVGRLYLVAQRIARERGYDERGYRVVMNCNADAGQSVYHIHLHLLAGRHLSWPPG
ncbi:MAG: histidine triad nucleotide-binding protein [Chromatiales bacterium]|nr:histidine triad nucleotide-binding protein [Gammaproteobacteria bacterium]MCP5352467.1 histidine triad nucleotide-binding protein [Chromatiales bacterium]